jgi:hypothetical protein
VYVEFSMCGMCDVGMCVEFSMCDVYVEFSMCGMCDVGMCAPVCDPPLCRILPSECWCRWGRVALCW